MSDRPTGANGKRSQAWGTTSSCPVCGQCLCFGCHPSGPCLDEQDDRPRRSRPRTGFGPSLGGWDLMSPGGGSEATRLS